ncbi:DUF2637 domain-containing protein [Pseudactinotalea sp. Z1748]|uniref:DUF2637 domain-containing protein n=1 Tax=Pseudactinotalea sp. Z1748 TaxID=3413027 RepID=UPI003C79808F
MSDPLAVKPGNRVLAYILAGGVVFLALAGFTLSFNALTDLAIHAGIDPNLAWLWPLIVDGFIVVATLSAFGLKRRGRTVTWYPWSALVLFAVVSVAGNAVHAVNAPELALPLWAASLVSAVPAIALLIASHLLVVLIEGRRSRPAPRRREPPKPTAERSEHRPDAATANGDELGARRGRAEAGNGVANGLSLVKRLEAISAEGGQITGAVIAEIEGVSERTGRRRLDRLREEHGHLFNGQHHSQDVGVR